VSQLKPSAGNTLQEQFPGGWLNLALLPCPPPKCCLLKSCQPGCCGGGEGSRPAFDPLVLLQLENSRAGNTAVTHRGLARAASTWYPRGGRANRTGRVRGEFIYLVLFYCLHKMAWKLKELIISLSILCFSFSTWLDLALIAHLFISFK